MFFWVALAVVLVVFVVAVAWGVRGYAGRVHRPGTQHLVDTKPPKPRKPPKQPRKR